MPGRLAGPGLRRPHVAGQRRAVARREQHGLDDAVALRPPSRRAGRRPRSRRCRSSTGRSRTRARGRRPGSRSAAAWFCALTWASSALVLGRVVDRLALVALGEVLASRPGRTRGGRRGAGRHQRPGQRAAGATPSAPPKGRPAQVRARRMTRIDTARASWRAVTLIRESRRRRPPSEGDAHAAAVRRCLHLRAVPVDLRARPLHPLAPAAAAGGRVITRRLAQRPRPELRDLQDGSREDLALAEAHVDPLLAREHPRLVGEVRRLGLVDCE